MLSCVVNCSACGVHAVREVLCIFRWLRRRHAQGSVAVAGSAITWLRDNLKIIKSAGDTEAVAGSVPDAGGVVFVPAFNGLFAPHWRADARGALLGLTGHTTAAHVVRAALEAVAAQCKEVYDAMAADAAGVVDRAAFAAADLRVDGGMTVNGLLMALQADYVGKRVVRPAVSETTALGAAYAAGLATGVWADVATLRAQWRVAATWEPTTPRPVVAANIRRWHAGVSRTLAWTSGATLVEVAASPATSTPVPVTPAAAAAVAAPPAAAGDDDSSAANASSGSLASFWASVMRGSPNASPAELQARQSSLFGTAITLAAGAIMGLALHGVLQHAAGRGGGSK